MKIGLEKKVKGFSLVEILVAIFIFMMVSMFIMEIFFNTIESRRRVRAVQQDTEDARYALELMAKTLRMSTVFSSSAGNIDFYDYSRKKCFRYRLSGGVVVMDSADGNETDSDNDGNSYIDSCKTNWTSAGTLIGGGVGALNFNVVKSNRTSSPVTLGKVTISMHVCYEGDCTAKGVSSAYIQSSVSLRDYGYIDKDVK